MILGTQDWCESRLLEAVQLAHSPTDHALFHTHTMHLMAEALSSAVARPRVWNSLAAHLCDEDIMYNIFRHELKP